MRFWHPFTLKANSRDVEQALAHHQRIGAKAGVQSDQPQFIVFFSRTIFFPKSPPPTRRPQNLTKFPFAPNFSKPDLEGL
jgi:hypothetical protein